MPSSSPRLDKPYDLEDLEAVIADLVPNR